MPRRYVSIESIQFSGSSIPAGNFRLDIYKYDSITYMMQKEVMILNLISLFGWHAVGFRTLLKKLSHRKDVTPYKLIFLYRIISILEQNYLFVTD